MTEGPEDTGTSGWERPTEPPAPATAPPTLDITSETPVRAGGLGGRLVAGALGLTLLVGGVAFAATQAGNDAGPSDPESAVRELFDAIAAEDVLGVLGTLDPGERDTIAEPVEQLFAELERLEVLDESFALDGIDGVDLEFHDLGLETQEIREDLVRVHLVGGTASFAVNTDEIPVGDFLVDTFDRLGVEYQGIEESESEALDPDAMADTFLVARDTGDGWRISLGYTAVEAARRNMGAPVPAAGGGLVPIGADSPEAAVEGFLRAAAAIDIEGAVARLSPGELRAVHDYWPVIAEDADLPTADDVDADIELTDLALRSETDGDRGRVFVESIGVDVVTQDFEGGGTISDGCIELRGDVRERLEDEEIELPDGPICEDDIEQIIEDAGGDEMGMRMGFGGIGMGLGGLGGLGFGDGETPDLGISVVQVDGEWFVAPVGTFADLGLAVLETLQREDLDTMVDAIEGFFGGFSTETGSGFAPSELDDFGPDFEDGFSTEDLDDGFTFETEVSTELEDTGKPLVDDPTGE